MAEDSKPERFLPVEIMLKILSKLPLEYRLQSRRVCKYWHGIISDPEFALSNEKPRQLIALVHWTGRSRHLPLHRRSRVLNLFRFIDRFVVDNRWFGNEPQLCNLASEASILMTFKGLLLLRRGKAIYLLNPMIRRFKRVFTEDFDSRVIGICCDSSTSTDDDYKILLSTGWASTAKDVVVRVGSFKTKTWKDVPFPYSFHIHGYDVLFVHERIHLFFNDRRCPDKDPPLLISFDATKDEFVEVPVPAPAPKDVRYEKGSRIRGLGVLNGHLAMSMSPRDSQVADIWVLEGHGVNESWTILFTLKSKCIGSDGLKPLGFTGDGELLISIETGCPMLYNPKKNSYRDALAKQLKGIIGSDIVSFEGTMFFPSHLTEFQFRETTQGKRKRDSS